MTYDLSVSQGQEKNQNYKGPVPIFLNPLSSSNSDTLSVFLGVGMGSLLLY